MHTHTYTHTEKQAVEHTHTPIDMVPQTFPWSLHLLLRFPQKKSNSKCCIQGRFKSQSGLKVTSWWNTNALKLKIQVSILFYKLVVHRLKISPSCWDLKFRNHAPNFVFKQTTKKSFIPWGASSCCKCVLNGPNAWWVYVERNTSS